MSTARDGGSAPPSRIDISRLDVQQVSLLRRVLDVSEVPYGIVRTEVIAAGDYAGEIERAVRWAAAEEPPTPEFDDPEYRSDRPPLVRPSRPPLRDGRHQATRYRRISAGVIDEVLVGVPTALASHAGAAMWTVVALHLVYYVVPTSLYGWSIGKLWLGTRVVDAQSLRTPASWQAFVRWLVPYAPVLVSLSVGLSGDAVGPLVLAAYAPILFDLRGVHDRLANTRVVERTVSGPGVWVRHRRTHDHA